MKITIMLLAFISILFAHSGRTDSNGGHYNRSTGQYHYHGGGYSKPKYTPTQTSYQCGKKTYCYQMTSCKEVMYYFNNCGLPKLDGDKDGTPCEKLCR
jgi:hypothetical protein